MTSLPADSGRVCQGEGEKVERRFLGSTAALIAGILCYCRVISRFVNTVQPGTFQNGLPQKEWYFVGMVTSAMMILGALAYRSLKKRKLGIVKDSRLRISLEFSALFIIAFLIFRNREIEYFASTYPFQFVVVPLWVFIAYGVLIFKDFDQKGE